MTNGNEEYSGTERRAGYQQMLSSQRKAEMVNRWLLTIFTIVTGLAIAMGSWSAKRIIDHEVRIATIESNRYTSADHMRFTQTVHAELALLRKEISTIPKEVPPVWFKERVDKNSKRLDRLEGR